MKKMMLAVGIIFVLGRLVAQTNVWQPSPGHTQIPIWPGAAPDAQAVPGPEYVKMNSSPGGASWIEAGNVSQPTMTVY